MYSQKQIKNWQVFEDIRKSGMFNMLDPRARAMTTMSISEWLFCMEHYNELKSQGESK